MRLLTWTEKQGRACQAWWRPDTDTPRVDTRRLPLPPDPLVADPLHARLLKTKVPDRVPVCAWPLVARAEAVTGQSVAERLFRETAAGWLAEAPGILALTWAPGGTVRYAQPASGNEDLLGLDLLRDAPEQTQQQARRALRTGNIALSPPERLPDGTWALSAQKAVRRNGDLVGIGSVRFRLDRVFSSLVAQLRHAGVEAALRTSASSSVKQCQKKASKSRRKFDSAISTRR